MNNPPLSEAIEVTFLVVAALERIGVRYLVGGSLASSLHGVPRSTLDVDLVAMMAQPHVARFVAALEGAFYVDAEMIRDAIRRRSCFNVIHLQTVFKVDVFVMPDTEESLIEMERRRTVTIPGDPPRTLVVASAEDTVLQKLAWFRLGGEISDRQWKDAQGVLRVQGTRLDMAYLRSMAPRLAVADLLVRALAEAGLSDR